MTARQLPPLNGLRAFEAAARHQSFARSAEELQVTPGAVSQQVKALEEHLGVPLFERRPQSLVLTEYGRSYLPSLRDAFDLIDGATRRLTGRAVRETIKLSLPSIFAVRWILPRLDRFHARFSNFELQLDTLERTDDAVMREADAAIRHGRGGWGDLWCDHLFCDHLVPVASPPLIAPPHQLSSPRDLLGFTLLRTAGRAVDWTDWFQWAGIAAEPTARWLNFPESSLALEAACNGLGIALVDFRLVARDVEAGRLLLPLRNLTFVRGTAWFLTYPPEARNSAAIASLRSWLLEETEEVVRLH